jgi:DNA-directed RNA polymerase specialized sigma24 family protein
VDSDAVCAHPARSAWVVRTALNTRVSWWRRARREIPLPERTADIAGDGSLGSVVDPELITVLLRLPERQRQVVALRLLLDLDTAATAEVRLLTGRHAGTRGFRTSRS